MTENELQGFRERVEWLEDEFPLPYPVSVQRVDYKRHCGGCFFDGERFTIKIAKRLDFSVSCYTLYEEWAHAREWDDSRDHGHAWAAEYGAIIRADEDREV